MKIDNNSGLANVGRDRCLAVNLESAQLRTFDKFTQVVAVTAVVNVE